MNLLITGAWPSAKEYIPRIESMGHHVCFLQQEKDDLPCDLDWVEGIICNGLFLYHPIKQLTKLRYIQLTSAGYDRVPMDYVQEHGIEINNARGVYSIPMAEFAVAGVLSIYKELGRFHDQQKEHRWEKSRNLRELNGKIVVILGCGSVGTECAKRFKAFGCTVIGVDIIPREDTNYDAVRPISGLDDLLHTADILLLTLPLTKETRGIINESRLNGLKKDAVLVNIARGAIIDREALEAWNGYAVLDVFEDEPLPESSSLWTKENMIITPHISFIGDKNELRLSKQIINNLEDGNIDV